MSAHTSDFGDFLREKRGEKKITLRKMAELLNISAPFLSDIEKGRRNPPDLSKLEQIAKILDLPGEEKETMLNLAGKERGSIAPDLTEYVMSRDYVTAALRIARDLDAGEEDWQRFANELKQRKRDNGGTDI